MTVAIPPAVLEPTRVTLCHRHILDEIDATAWDRLVASILKDEQDRGMTLPLAERILDQTLAFLALQAAGLERGVSYSPSPLVDIGWHKLITYTVVYQAVCDMLGGFIHHNPFDVPGVDYSAKRRGGIARTVAGLRALGLMVDEPLWVVLADCGGPNGCEGGETRCD